MRGIENLVGKAQNETSKLIEKNSANIRVITSDLKAVTKFINKKNDDSQRLQEIISNFKDRLMEKYAILADEYVE